LYQYYLLAQDIVWRIMSNPGARYDQGSIETACDIGFAVSRVLSERLKEEKARVEALERELLMAEVASQLVASNAKQPEALSPVGKAISQKTTSKRKVPKKAA
jgi:anti-sigma factor ChrR (cupin superfamily)